MRNISEIHTSYSFNAVRLEPIWDEMADVSNYYNASAQPSNSLGPLGINHDTYSVIVPAATGTYFYYGSTYDLELAEENFHSATFQARAVCGLPSTIIAVLEARLECVSPDNGLNAYADLCASDRKRSIDTGSYINIVPQYLDNSSHGKAHVSPVKT